ncbi:MAG: hypothetical protein K8I82_31725, partial [Anaerolineae bacterium]|nr:hypothetical protein [Anaerolineae bacterium]
MRAYTPRAFIFLLPLLAVGISLVALYFAAVQSDSSQIVIEGSDSQTTEESLMLLEQANLVLERANDAVGSAELILSFLEGGSILAGVILVGAG